MTEPATVPSDRPPERIATRALLSPLALVVLAALGLGCSLKPGNEFPPGEPDAEAGASAETGDGSMDATPDASVIDDGPTDALDDETLGDDGRGDVAVLYDAPIVSDDGPTDAGCDGSTCACARDASTAGFSAWYALTGLSLWASEPVAGVSPMGTNLELFAVDDSQSVTTAVGQPPLDVGAWTPWTALATGGLPLGTPLTAIGDGSGVDLFAVKDGNVVTLPSGSTGGWIIVGSDPPAFAAQRVAATARDPSHVHVLALSNGSVYESDSGYTGTGFSAWSAIGGSTPAFVSATAVTLAARPTQLDAFALSDDGHFYDSSRAFQPADTGWGSWSRVGDPFNVFPAGGTIAAVSFRAQTEVDVFAIGNNQGIYSNFRNDNSFNGDWFGWFGLPGQARPGSRLAAMATASGMSVFLIPAGGDPSHTGPVQVVSYDEAQGWSGAMSMNSPCDTAFTADTLEAISTSATQAVIAVDDAGVVHVANRPLPP